jgi:hypothetical protein
MTMLFLDAPVLDEEHIVFAGLLLGLRRPNTRS